jgi:hypothetical protein
MMALDVEYIIREYAGDSASSQPARCELCAPRGHYHGASVPHLVYAKVPPPLEISRAMVCYVFLALRRSSIS